MATREHYRADGTCDCDVYGDGDGNCTGCDCCEWQGSRARPDAACARDLHCDCGAAGEEG
jgi:hypothetical protein